jgi:hypothetical protein
MFHNTPSSPFDSDSELHHKAVPQCGLGLSKSLFRVSVFLSRITIGANIIRYSRGFSCVRK